MNIYEFLDAMDYVDDTIKMEVTDTMFTAKKGNKKFFRTTVIAAVVAAMLCTGVCAAVLSSMSARDVTNEHISGTWGGQSYALEDAALELRFSIEADTCYEVEFKPGWLPVEPDNHHSPNREGWYTHLSNWGDLCGELPYVIYAFNGEQLRNGEKYLNGNVEIVSDTEWKGWKRTDIHVDYRGIASATQDCMLDRNYIMLFSQQDNYLIYIASSMYDLDTLEKMAEGLTVEVTNRVAQPVENSGVSYFDLGRG